METVFKSAVFFVLCFTETIAPICDPEILIADGNDPHRWDEEPRWDTDRDYLTFNCVWESWGSWSGCFRGKKTRYRIGEDDLNNCRCDSEFQTQYCEIVGKSPKICVHSGRPASYPLNKQCISHD